MDSATSCIFCRILRGELTPGVLAFRDAHTAVFPSRLQQPQNLGHMLVVPITHIDQIYQIDDDLAGPLMITLARASAVVKQVFNADGISIRQNNEAPAGQDVFHLHFHVIPRFADDGFTALDRSLGAIEVPIEKRREQARKLAHAIARSQ